VTPEEILAKAAEDIAIHGHAKEKFYSSTSYEGWQTAPACALGAIARVTGYASKSQGIVREEIFESEAAKKLAATIRGKVDGFSVADDYQTITGYNDHKDTTAEDMILAMKEAAHRG